MRAAFAADADSGDGAESADARAGGAQVAASGADTGDASGAGWSSVVRPKASLGIDVELRDPSFVLLARDDDPDRIVTSGAEADGSK